MELAAPAHWAALVCVAPFELTDIGDIQMYVFWNENGITLIQNSLKFVSSDPVNMKPALVQMMAWCRKGDKPLSEPILFCWRIHASLGLSDLNYINSLHAKFFRGNKNI